MAGFQEIIHTDGSFILRLLVAMVLGGLIGFERQTRGRPAGLRTNIVVCLGSAAVIVAFQKLSLELNLDAESIVRMDPARAAAGVVTGIGFLGAGTIIKSNDFIRGLTTAASIWVVAAVGVTVGLGDYVIGVVLTLLVLLALYALHRLSISSDHYFSLHLKWHGNMDLLNEVTDTLKKQQIHIKSRAVTCHPNSGKYEVHLALRMRYKGYENHVIEKYQSDTRFDEVALGR